MSRFTLRLAQLWWMIRKEVLSTLKDPKTKIILIMPVLVQSFLFGYAATFDLDRVPYVAVDMSHSTDSAELLARIDSSKVFHRVAALATNDEIAPYIESGEAVLAIVISQDFESRLSNGGSAYVQIISDGRNTTTAGIASGYVNRIINQYNRELNPQAGGIDVMVRAWYNPNLFTRWSFIPGLLGMLSLIQVMILSGLSVAREREQGTFDQLLVTPLSPTQILIGKAVVPLCIGLVQALGVFLISRFWFNIELIGSFGLLFAVLVVFNLSATGIGLCVSAVSGSMQQVMVYSFVLLLPMVLLSGMATPVHNMPQVLQILTYADPLRFALDALRRVYLEGAVLGDIWPDFIPMIIVSGITLPIAGWLFRHKTT